MKYQEAVEYLLHIPKFAGKTNHENLRGYLRLLGNPQEQVPAIHIAGTNGKGSVCAFLSSILEQAGYKIGIFTSPHLIRMNERFRIGQTMIPDEAFSRIFEQVYEAVQAGMKQGLVHPNFFEFLFLMAGCWYAEQDVDYVIYETGLGGRLDATNILQPELTVITSIGMDHMKYLGDTIEKIAGEKAGILKAGVPCIYLNQPIEAARVIQETARRLQAPLFAVEKEKISIDEIGEETIDFSYISQYDRGYKIKKTALYQTENAMLAVRAAECLFGKKLEGENLAERFAKDEEMQSIIRKGLYNMRWAGRMEELEPGIYVDGAHNEPAIRAFCETISGLYNDKNIILVFAVVNDKQYNNMIQILCERLKLQNVIVTAIGGTRATSPEAVKEQFIRYGNAPVQTAETPRQALELAKDIRTADCRIFCTGSLYLVGELEAEKED